MPSAPAANIDCGQKRPHNIDADMIADTPGNLPFHGVACDLSVLFLMIRWSIIVVQFKQSETSVVMTTHQVQRQSCEELSCRDRDRTTRLLILFFDDPLLIVLV